jgi:hypothetical protein
MGASPPTEFSPDGEEYFGSVPVGSLDVSVAFVAFGQASPVSTVAVVTELEVIIRMCSSTTACKVPLPVMSLFVNHVRSCDNVCAAHPHRWK